MFFRPTASSAALTSKLAIGFEPEKAELDMDIITTLKAPLLRELVSTRCVCLLASLKVTIPDD
jgi:hypothetical protein